MPKVSVIVPVYQVEQYLPQCLDSVCAQTLRDIEIIIVDDGSPDKSGAICDAYAARDARVRVIHKENGGLASARNAGLRVATGEYIGFVDSDDWIEPVMYERMYQVASESRSDIVCCNVFRDADQKQQPFLEAGLYDRPAIVEQIFPRLLAVLDERTRVGILRWSNWQRIYRHALVREHNIAFDDRFRRCQDLPFTFECTIHAQRYYYLAHDYLYHNRLNIESLSKGYTRNMWSLIKPLILYLYDVVKRYRDYDFSRLMDLRAFHFAIECAENEVKVGNQNSLRERVRIISEIGRDPLMREVLPRLDPRLMIPRTRVYFQAARLRLPLLIYWTALWRFRNFRKATRKMLRNPRQVGGVESNNVR